MQAAIQYSIMHTHPGSEVSAIGKGMSNELRNFIAAKK